MAGLVSGSKYLGMYNWEGGMDDEQAYADRVTYATDTTMLTTGYDQDAIEGGWLEVGGPYEMDPMGEQRDDKTFKQPEPQAMGQIGMLSTAGATPQATMTTVGGKSVAQAPQNYGSQRMAKKND